MTKEGHAVRETGRLRLFLREMFCVFLFEFFNTTGGINQLLLTGEKGMAGRTDFNLHALVDRTQFYLITASAFRLDFVIFGMDIRFHRLLGLRRIYSHNSELVFASYFIRVKIKHFTRISFLNKGKSLSQAFFSAL